MDLGKDKKMRPKIFIKTHIKTKISASIAKAVIITVISNGIFQNLTLLLTASAQEKISTFAELCANKSNLATPTRHTIDRLLQTAGTIDCQQAAQKLSTLTNLDLSNSQIVDLSPLSSLTNLTSINLIDNQITDLKPLTRLTKLNFALLAKNKITDISPLSSLNNLTYLVLDENQITKANALSSLNKLIVLSLLSNPIIEKKCPVLPATICIFSNDGEDLYKTAESQYQQGKFREALKTFQDVLAVYERTGDRRKSADTVNRLGDIYANLSQYPQSLSFYQQGLTIRRELGDLPGVGVSLNSLAVVYEKLGQYQKAQDTLKQALDNINQQKKGGIPLEGGIYELPKDEGAIMNSLALIGHKLGNYEDALNSATQALKLYDLLPEDYPGKLYGKRVTLDTIGVSYLLLKQPQKAQQFLEQSLTIARQISDQSGEGKTLNHLGDLYFNLGDSQKALSFYQQALTLYRQVSDRASEGATLNNIGLILLQTNQLKAATENLMAAIKIWESLRPGLTDDNKVSLFETQAVTYSYLQTALIAQEKTEAALEMAERGRARAFIELLASRIGGQSSGQFQSPNPPTIEEIRQIAKQQNATIVEYSIVGDKIYIWVIAPTGIVNLRTVNISNLNISLQDTAEKTRVAAATGISRGMGDQEVNLSIFVRGTRDQVEEKTATSPPEIAQKSPTNPQRLMNRNLKKAYQLLIKPIADLLPKDPKSRVIFVPQNSLFLVPFAALQDEEGNYLIEKHTILVSPAIQVLNLTRQHRQNHLQNRGSKIVIIGNPIMPIIPPALGQTPEPLKKLPASEKEAIAIGKLLNAQPMIGQSATEKAVVEALPNARIVHFATHGLLGEIKHLGLGVPGALALASTGTSPAEDGLLTSSEILDLKLNAELVVLSACNTGRGKITGDGVIGLSRAFIAAGVSSIIVSLWLVPDDSTSELMAEFYHQIEQNPDRAKALRQAMLAIMKKYPEPRDWAAFMLMGEAE